MASTSTSGSGGAWQKKTEDFKGPKQSHQPPLKLWGLPNFLETWPMINDDQCLYVFLRFHVRFPSSECLFELLSFCQLLPWPVLVALIPPTSSSDSESDDASQKTWPAAPASVWQIQARLVMDDRSKRFVYITSFYRTAYLGKKETKYPKKHLKNM